jgi:hypothetical protein
MTIPTDTKEENADIELLFLILRKKKNSANEE